MARIVFFGTPDFAKIILGRLLDNPDHKVMAVITQPDRPAGRGNKIQESAVKSLARQAGLPIFQPETLKAGTESGDSIYNTVRELNPDLGVVAAYGRIIPSKLLNTPKQGMINVHASLLPRWRGAAPIHRAIEAGDIQTGVCIMRMVPGLDEGPVFASNMANIFFWDNTEDITMALAERGSDLLKEFIPAIAAGQLDPMPQEGTPTYAKKIERKDGQLTGVRGVNGTYDQVRAMIGWPGSFINWSSDPTKQMKLWEAKKEEKLIPVGQVRFIGARLFLGCGNGSVSFAEGQLANKKRMSITNLLNGMPAKDLTDLVQTGAISTV